MAIIYAFFVGFLYVAPNLFFISSMGDSYKGLPMMQTPNEDFYLARMQEIVDGHPMLGSHAFYEYKDQWPLAPPAAEFLYAISSIIFNTSPVNILVASRFFLPFILFLLIYFLIHSLTENANFLSNKINAIAGALFVTLGYDLIDYRHVWGFLAGEHPFAGGFLLWARPVNPITGAIFLFSFLICIWQIIDKTKWKRTNIFCAAIFLSLMIMSYFFSWGIALSVTAILILIYLFKKESGVLKDIGLVFLTTFILTLPHWYTIWRASRSVWYEESVLRSGLFNTHYPLLNKFVLAVLVAYIILIAFQIFRHEKSEADSSPFPEHLNALRRSGIGGKTGFKLQNWHWFCLALVLGSLWAYSQQIITGRTVWPYHFVQYTIPLGIIVMLVSFYNIIKKESAYLWRAGVVFIMLVSLSAGIYTQISVYYRVYPFYVDQQSLMPTMKWINEKEKDCVLLVAGDKKTKVALDGLIPAFTHCNTYNSTWIFSIMPQERVYHSYLTRIFFNGATDQNIDQYLSENMREAGLYLFSNWKGLYRVKQFPDFSDPTLEERIEKVPEDYRQFLTGGIRAKLERYKLDYILVSGDLSQNLKDFAYNLELVYSFKDIKIYKF